MLTEQCYGIIVVLKKENKFLILERVGDKGDWTFPKGHHEGTESPVETALRETQEETGITEIEIADFPPIHEEYEIVVDGEKRLKMNDYFIGFVDKSDVTIEKGELQSYKWAKYKEAYDSFRNEIRKDVVVKAQEYLKSNGKE